MNPLILTGIEDAIASGANMGLGLRRQMFEEQQQPIQNDFARQRIGLDQQSLALRSKQMEFEQAQDFEERNSLLQMAIKEGLVPSLPDGSIDPVVAHSFRTGDKQAIRSQLGQVWEMKRQKEMQDHKQQGDLQQTMEKRSRAYAAIDRTNYSEQDKQQLKESWDAHNLGGVDPADLHSMRKKNEEDQRRSGLLQSYPDLALIPGNESMEVSKLQEEALSMHHAQQMEEGLGMTFPKGDPRILKGIAQSRSAGMPVSTPTASVTGKDRADPRQWEAQKESFKIDIANAEDDLRSLESEMRSLQSPRAQRELSPRVEEARKKLREARSSYQAFLKSQTSTDPGDDLLDQWLSQQLGAPSGQR